MFHALQKLLTALVLSAALGVCTAGLDEAGDIDIVRVEESTGQVHLVLVLDPTQRVESPEILAKVKRKLSAYRYYVTSGQIWKQQRNGNRELPVSLDVVVTGELTSAGVNALGSLKTDFNSAPTAFGYQHMPFPKKQ